MQTERAAPGRRVLLVMENSTFPNDARVRREAYALTEAGYSVSVICPAAKGQPLTETIDGVHLYRYPAPRRGSGMLGYLWEYGYAMLATAVISARVLKERGFDAIHAANPPDLYVLVAAPYKLLGKKFIFDHHDISPEMYMTKTGFRGNPFVYRMLLGLERLSCRVADHVIATNESYRSLEIARDGVSPERITVVRNGPETGEVRPVEPDPALRARSPMLIGYMGAIGNQDGVDYFLRAINHLVHDLNRRDFEAVIMGAGDAVPDLMGQTEALGIGDFVNFTGWVDRTRISEALSSMDICVAPEPSNPYTDRSTIVKMMDYMAAGRPIVAFELPEHRFTAGDAAVYARPNDELEMAKAIASLMDSPEERKRMGALGRQRIEEVLNWSCSRPQLLGVYQRLLPLHEQEWRRQVVPRLETKVTRSNK